MRLRPASLIVLALLALPAVVLAAVPTNVTNVRAVPRDGSAAVYFKPPASDGGSPITVYVVASSPGGDAAKGAGPPMYVTGLQNDTSYTFTVRAMNASGFGPDSAPSNPVTPSAATITPAISAAESFSIALDAHGQVYAWGSDSVGQLGQGRPLLQASPIQVPGLPPIQHIDIFDQVLAVDTTGQVWSWGDGTCAHLGPRASANGARPARIVGATGFSKVAAGYCHSYGLKSDGTVWELLGEGNQNLGFPTGITDIASGGGHLLARRNDGTVWAYGNNFWAELGQGHNSPVSTAVQVPGLTSVLAISAGLTTSMALLGNGEIRVWGADYYNNRMTSPTPLTGLGGPAIAISASTQGSYAAVRNDGSVWLWEYGNGTPTQVPAMTGATKVGHSFGRALFGIAANGALSAFGENADGQLGQGNTGTYANAVAVPGFGTATTMVSVGNFSASVVALRGDGTVWFWGANPSGQRGDGEVVGSPTPLAVPLPARIAAISASYRFALALDTTGHLWGWGTNSTSDLAAGGVNLASPVQLPGISDVATITTSVLGGFAFTKTDGTAWRAANGNLTSSGLADIARVALPVSAALYLGNDGTLFGAGLNNNGQFGDGTTNPRPVPSALNKVPGPVSKVVADWYNVAALLQDGRVCVWGALNTGESITNGTNLPVCLQGVQDAVDIAINSAGGILRRADGSITGWGRTWAAPFGTGHTTTYPIASTPATQAFAVTLDAILYAGTTGVVYGQGRNSPASYGSAVGDGTYVQRSTAVVALAHAGTGSVDANNWFLDLAPDSIETIPPTLVPTALATAQASGATASLALQGSIKYKSADLGKRVNNYVLAIVPPAFFNQVTPAPGRSDMPALMAKAAKAGGFVLAQLTPAGWTDVTGQLIAYSTGTANAAGGASNILNGINTTSLAGSRFCVGYGESAQSMLSASALREVLLLEGTASIVSGVPCVLSGVYVDGPSTSIAGTSVGFNASVVGLSPTGSVSFSDGFAALGSVGLAASNAAVARASIATSSLAPGPHSIGATYSGDSTNPAAASELPMVHTVRAPMAGSQTVLAGPASALSGAEATFTVTVTGNGPTGTVQFRDGAVDLGSPAALVAGSATLRISTLALGNHSITAAYSGDTANAASTSAALGHLVADVITTAVSLSVSSNAPKVGTPVTLTAIVSGASPTGTVQFRDNDLPLGGPVALAGGQAAHTTSMLAAGTHVVTASYSGDGDDAQATSPARVIEVTLQIDPAQAAADTDGDGLSNAVEAAEQRNPLIKDNDIFAVARLYAMQQYRDFLGREGDPGGVTHWTNQLSSGAQSRAQMAETFFTSAEFQGTGAPVARLYFAYFLRIPDYGGLNYWIGQFRGGNSLEAISNLFAASPEFVATYGALDNAGFVDRVYRNVLGRAPDAGGLAYWKGRIDGGMTRGRMMVEFSESPEYRALIANEIYVTMMYAGMLRREPDAGGFSYWVGYMDAGNSGLALTGAFVAAPEYRGRFLP